MKKLLIIVRYLGSIHLLGILFFTLFRTVLYFTNTHRIGEVENESNLFFTAFGNGLLFDNAIASYISLIPVLLLSAIALFNRIPRQLVYFCNSFFILLYTLAFLICVADVPYFSYFFIHIGWAAFEWFKFGSDTMGMILEDSNYYLYFVLWIISVVAFSLLVCYLGRKLLHSTSFNLKGMKDYSTYISLTILLWLVCFAGMRSSFQSDPLKLGDAYFSNHSFFNRLGVNPVFHLAKSHSGKRYMTVNDLMTTTEAITLAQKELGVNPDESELSPVARFCKADGEELKANVVIILMESMSTAYLEYEYNGKNLTPFLHELIEKSWYFENFYSSGTHTNNGIVSSLYGYPTLFDKPMTKEGNSSDKLYKGLPYCLHEKGYRNFFFITGNPNFDYMNEFLYNSYFDRIYSLFDYPSEKAVNKFGVPDDYLFEYGLKTLNTAGRETAPFLATFLTVSNHGPIVVPPQFVDFGDTDTKRIIAFADNSLRLFMEGAEKEEWYNNTIFVLLGDHGAPLGTTKYDMYLSQNSIPCIIYSPLFGDMPKRFKQYGGQIDLFPTIMGLLNCSFENNSLGIDLLKETRPYMFFVTDNQLGCINNDYFYVRNLENRSDFLYNRHSENAENLAKDMTDTKEKLKNYAVSMTITADYLLNQTLTKK